MEEENKANDFIERMKDESAELSSKIEKLGTFMGTERFFSIELEQQNLMLQQFNAMVTYSNILNHRISSLTFRLAQDGDKH